MIRTAVRRRGSVLIESAAIYPILFLIILAIILLGLTVFRFQQVAHIAREASRWASVHGAQYAKETGNPAATPTDVYNSAILPMASGMDPTGISYSVTWNSSNSPTHSVVKSGTVTAVSNTVLVKVTYTWNTGLFGTIPVSSTSVNIMSY